MKQKSANGIIYGVKHTFGFTILLGGMRKRETEHDTILREESAKFMVVILTSISVLEIINVHVKLFIEIFSKMHKFVKDIC